MKTKLYNIGTWGKLHYDFLYRNQRSVINAMREYGGEVEHLGRCELNTFVAVN